MTLLQKRIEQYKLPRWPYQPAYDRIVVYILPEDAAARESFAKGGLILKPEKVRARDKSVSPRAVLLAAGLGAMDHLRSQLIDLGHIIWVARFSPWRHVVDVDADGKDVELMFLRSADVVGSEDVEALLAEKKATVIVGADGRHQYKADDSIVPRFDPPEILD